MFHTDIIYTIFQCLWCKYIYIYIKQWALAMLALVTRPYQGCETLEKQIETPSGKWKPRGSSYVIKNNMAKQTRYNIRKSMSQRFQRQFVFFKLPLQKRGFWSFCSAPNFNLIPLEYVLPSWFLKMKASGSGYVYVFWKQHHTQQLPELHFSKISKLFICKKWKKVILRLVVPIWV